MNVFAKSYKFPFSFGAAKKTEHYVTGFLNDDSVMKGYFSSFECIPTVHRKRSHEWHGVRWNEWMNAYNGWMTLFQCETDERRNWTFILIMNFLLLYILTYVCMISYVCFLHILTTFQFFSIHFICFRSLQIYFQRLIRFQILFFFFFSFSDSY